MKYFLWQGVRTNLILFEGSMEFRVRRKTSQPAAQPFPPVTLFFTVGLLLKHSQGLAGKCDVF